MIEVIKDILLPLIAIVISIIALVVTINSNQKVQDANKKAEDATDLANRISNGQIELAVASLITQTENRVADIGIKMSEILYKGERNDEERQKLGFYKSVYKQATESNLNAYEEACAKYRDGKIDKDRFKRMYDRPIRRIVEEDELKEYFTPQVSSAFKCILKVYEEWNNPEQ